MEKSNKMMLGAALVVALVALAGAGYAASNYTATTINGGNSLQSEYIELTQTGDAKYSENLFLEDSLSYDTLNYWKVVDEVGSAVTVYKPHLDTTISVSGTTATVTPVNTGGKYVKVSGPLELNIDTTNASGVTSVKLDISVTNFTPVLGMKYAILLNGATYDYFAEVTDNNGWHFNSIRATDIYSVELYIGLDETNLVTVTEAEAGDKAGSYIGSSDNIASAGFAITNPSVFTFVAEPVVTP